MAEAETGPTSLPKTRRGGKVVLAPKAEDHPLFLNKAKWEGDIRIGSRLYRLHGQVANFAAGASKQDHTLAPPTHSICVLRCDEEEIRVRTNFAQHLEADAPHLEVSTESLG